jgi:hypothetical protein
MEVVRYTTCRSAGEDAGALMPRGKRRPMSVSLGLLSRSWPSLAVGGRILGPSRSSRPEWAASSVLRPQQKGVLTVSRETHGAAYKGPCWQLLVLLHPTARVGRPLWFWVSACTGSSCRGVAGPSRPCIRTIGTFSGALEPRETDQRSITRLSTTLTSGRAVCSSCQCCRSCSQAPQVRGITQSA